MHRCVLLRLVIAAAALLALTSCDRSVQVAKSGATASELAKAIQQAPDLEMARKLAAGIVVLGDAIRSAMDPELTNATLAPFTAAQALKNPERAIVQAEAQAERTVQAGDEYATRMSLVEGGIYAVITLVGTALGIKGVPLAINAVKSSGALGGMVRAVETFRNTAAPEVRDHLDGYLRGEQGTEGVRATVAASKRKYANRPAKWVPPPTAPTIPPPGAVGAVSSLPV